MTGDGPSLETYVETRLSLLTEQIRKDKQEHDRFEAERDRRYEERHNANEQALSKVASEMLAKFAAVNEFRGAMGDAQRLFIPRAEVDVIVSGLGKEIGTLSMGLDRMLTERAGIKGGWGYAMGLLGAVALVGSIIAAFARLL